jgi:hypothetical protein
VKQREHVGRECTGVRYPKPAGTHASNRDFPVAKIEDELGKAESALARSRSSGLSEKRARA